LAPCRQSIEKLYGKSFGIEPHDFAVPLDFTLIVRKGARHHHILPYQELGFTLDIGPTGTEVFDTALEKLAVGSKMGVFRASDSAVPAGLSILGTAEEFFTGFGHLPRSGLEGFGNLSGHGISHKMGKRLMPGAG
jgi:hypothetical protein